MNRPCFTAIVALALLGNACGEKRDDSKVSEPTKTTDAGARPTPKAPANAIDPAAKHEIVSEDVSFTVEGRAIAGTITRPQAPGRWPGIVMQAGSGPTDRDWTSPMLEGKNGSGKLIAEELSRRGAVVIRFDKLGSGNNAGPSLDKLSFDSYRDEARGALALLLARPEVDPARVFALGNSMGGIHSTELVLAEKGKFAGVVFLASASRSMADTMMTQLAETNFRDSAKMTPEEVEHHMAPIRQAFADFLAGKQVDASKVGEIPEIQQMLAGMFAPQAAALARPLFAYDNAVQAAKLEVPVLVLNGGKDIQIDPELDARRLDKHLREAGRDVTLHICPDANHVFKHEPKTMEELRANPMLAIANYAAEGGTLDPDFVTALLDWLAKRTAAP